MAIKEFKLLRFQTQDAESFWRKNNTMYKFVEGTFAEAEGYRFRITLSKEYDNEGKCYMAETRVRVTRIKDGEVVFDKRNTEHWSRSNKPSGVHISFGKAWAHNVYNKLEKYTGENDG